MKYRRYGKFRFNDYCFSWTGIITLLLFTIFSVILDLSFLFIVFPMICAIIWLLAILLPNCERFSISEDSLLIRKRGKEQKITIPAELTFIISYADICPPLTIRTPIGNQTHILKNKYAISIFEKMPLDFALKCLHKNYIRKYTTSTIKISFDEYRYIYSFVCEYEILNKLLENRNYLLIIPESLSKRYPLIEKIANCYIDIGY